MPHPPRTPVVPRIMAFLRKEVSLLTTRMQDLYSREVGITSAHKASRGHAKPKVTISRKDYNEVHFRGEHTVWKPATTDRFDAEARAAFKPKYARDYGLKAFPMQKPEGIVFRAAINVRPKIRKTRQGYFDEADRVWKGAAFNYIFNSFVRRTADEVADAVADGVTPYKITYIGGK